MSRLSSIVFKGVICCTLVICVSVGVLAQNEKGEQAPEKNNGAQLFDSYGDLNSEDLSARLDNYTIELQSNPDKKGYLICYAPEEEGPGTGKFILRAVKDYLANNRGIEGQKIELLYGGRYKDPADVLTELWIAPQGALAPEPKHFKSKLKTFAGKFDEYEGGDGFGDEADGISLGDVKFAAAADLLKQQPKSVAYFVAFNFKGASPGTWRRAVKRSASGLQSYGIESERIKTIFGGLRKSEKDEDPQLVKIQLWILPDNAPPPIKEAKPERTPKEAVQIGLYGDYLLKYPENERQIFEGFAAVLRADPHLNLYLIVRPPVPEENIPVNDYVPPPSQVAEPPDVDLIKLTEKWKGQLMKDYGVNQNRVMIVPAAAKDFNAGTVEVWVLPPGAALPDPNPIDQETAETENPEEF